MKSAKKKRNRMFLDRLDKEETHVRKVLEADAGDVKDLMSEWQERDSPSENNLRTVEWSQYSSLQNVLAEIGKAKRRIQEGTYGICDTCKMAISAKRLKALPVALYCIQCQEKLEAEPGAAERRPTL